jgi:enamine deaminase RidA (YjgF/YER057c/UK114 family)
VSEHRRLFTNSTFERDIGYARAVIDGDYVYISGTTGYDYSTMTIAEGVIEQTRQLLRNIDEVLRDAGTVKENIVRVRYIFPDRSDFEPCWPLFKAYFSAAPPAATMIVADLFDPAMRLEVEVTARCGP